MYDLYPMSKSAELTTGVRMVTLFLLKEQKSYTNTHKAPGCDNGGPVLPALKKLNIPALREEQSTDFKLRVAPKH